MSEYEKLLALCRSCISSLNSALETELPNSVKLQLQQKVFILEAAMSDLSSTDIQDDLPSDLKEASKIFEANIIKKAIKLHGSKRKAAKALGLDHSTLIKKCQRYEI